MKSASQFRRLVTGNICFFVRETSMEPCPARTYEIFIASC
jgi:hypothetical protein